MNEEPMYVDERVSNDYKRAQEESELETRLPETMPEIADYLIMGRMVPHDPGRRYKGSNGIWQQ